MPVLTLVEAELIGAIREYELAIKDYNRALELRPNYAWAYVSRGQTNSLRKEYIKSIND